LFVSVTACQAALPSKYLAKNNVLTRLWFVFL
jgi:hypothetical protein